MGELTTHVLDAVRGTPAAGMRIDLMSLDGDIAARVLKIVTTNDAGRTDEPLLVGRGLKTGRYELCFHVGDYFRAAGLRLTEPPFLDLIPVRFAAADPTAHYHIPLLVSPWSYTIYRGG